MNGTSTNGTTQAHQVDVARVQREARARMRKRAAGLDTVGAAMTQTRLQAAERLKAQRVQARLRRLPGWKMPAAGTVMDRVRRFEDPAVANAYVTFASLLARSARQPLHLLLSDGNVIMALTGRSSGDDKGITEEVLDLAGQLG